MSEQLIWHGVPLEDFKIIDVTVDDHLITMKVGMCVHVPQPIQLTVTMVDPGVT